MPKYRNDGLASRIVPGLFGLSVTVRPGETVETYSALTGPGWTRISDEPYAPLTSIRKSVTAPGSVSGLRDSALISLVADAAGIVATPNAAENEHGFELPKDVVIEIENLGEIETLYFAGAGNVLVQAGDGIVRSPGALRIRRGRGSSSAVPVPPAVNPAPGPNPPTPAPNYPAGLSLLWRSSQYEKSLVGANPGYSGTPSVDADGVLPGHGPNFAAAPSLHKVGTLALKGTALKASASLTDEVHIFGPIHALDTGLAAKIGTGNTTVAMSWSFGDKLEAVVNLASLDAADITAPAPRRGAYYVESVIRDRASFVAPSGINKYQNGIYKVICAGSRGDTTLGVTGGDSLDDATNKNWKCVVEYPDGTLEFNIVSKSEAAQVVLLYPLSKDGPVTVWSAWEKTNGQHYSRKGCACRAELLYKLDRRYAVRDATVYTLGYEDVLTPDPWVRINPQVWVPVGGLQNNKVNYNGVLNPFTAGKLVFAGCRRHVRVTTTDAGQGVQLNVPIETPFTGRLEFSIGVNSDAEISGLDVRVSAGGVDVYTAVSKAHVRAHDVYLSNATDIVVSVTRIDAGPQEMMILLGAVHLFTDVGEPGTLISRNSKVLLCGDSWLDEEHVTGGGFAERLRQLMAGGTGAVIPAAKQGMTTAWALKWLPKYLEEHRPNVCVINFFTNDNNEQTSNFTGPDGNQYPLNVGTHEQWAGNMRSLVDMCLDNNCIPIVMLPDTTSSEAQSVAHMSMQNKIGSPTLVKEWLTKATASELANQACICNARNKMPGRKLTRINDNTSVVATDPGPASVWQAGTGVMRINRGAYVAYDGAVPDLVFATAAPVKLREVQVWDKTVGKDEIDGVPQ